MIKTPRLIAFETLYKIFNQNSYSNLAVDASLSGVDIDDRDKALATTLVYGVAERRLTLDWYINKHLSGRTKPKIMIILRMGAYQLLFMDKIPSSAAINESVKLCKTIKQDYYAKLVNAVLHKIDNDPQGVQDIEDAAIRYSVPNDLLNMWYKAYGVDKVLSFLPYINGKPPLNAIPNSMYINADELLYELNCEGVKGEVRGDTVLIQSGFNIALSDTYNRGLFYVQDLSCYEFCKAVGAKSGDTVLDMCSSPGGKSFTIAQQMHNNGKIYSFDLHENRVGLVQSSAKRLGLGVIETKCNDAAVYNSSIPMADIVLCDVPCSGFGIIRSKPEIRYKSLDSIKELPQLQYQILSVSSKYVKKGGKLAYSTCTLSVKENESVVKKFLLENKNFDIVREQTTFMSDSSDGFYYAVLMRKADG